MANRKRHNCPMRHDNGNCIPCGGFCTAVNDSICEALHNAFRYGESEERDRLVLSMIDANTKYQERQLKILRNIHKRVTEDTDSVVRCNNCKHTETDNTEDQAIYCKKWDRWEMPKDFFCGYGERKNAEKDI